MRRAFFVLTVVLVLLVSIAPAANAKPVAWTTIRYHVVQPGETIYCIARAYGVAPWAISAHNGLMRPDLIHPGKRLAIPNAYTSVPAGPTCTPQGHWHPWPDCTCAYYHTIVAGENLYRISLNHGVSMWHVAECNHIYDLNYIRAGYTLCIPDP
jgi:hypothetical protein